MYCLHFLRDQYVTSFKIAFIRIQNDWCRLPTENYLVILVIYSYQFKFLDEWNGTTMAPAANHYSMTSLLALLQLILFITCSSSEAASTGSSKPKSPTVLRPSTMHPAFESAGKKAGTQIWRIEVIYFIIIITRVQVKVSTLTLFHCSFFIKPVL